MTDYRTSGIHQINKWLWSNLQTLQYLDFQSGTQQFAFGEYGTGKIELVPIIPAQQQPEFTNIVGGAPFIVYGYSRGVYNNAWHCVNDKATFIVYDADEERLRAIHNYLFELLKRFDDTAADINTFLGNSSTYNFKYVKVDLMTSPEPATQEGGRQGAAISISFEYTYELSTVVGASGFGMKQ